MSSSPHIKPLPPEAGAPPDVATPARPRGHGWVVFATLMLFMAGVFNAIAGLVALAASKFYVAGAMFVWSDLRTWGWIVLALGVVELLAGGAILRGRRWGRWFGIGVASLNAIGQMVFIPAYPWWSLLIIALDILVIYGLATYGAQEAY
ncbi:MAG TPA: hypothetical protein VJY65_06560 [Chloroflexota bacterium]|nr:hypothetical protein [Chloroflexota bacterium]